MGLRRCDQNIIETLRLVEKMVKLAQQGDAEREDVACGVLYGVMLDAAFKIKKLAEQEKEAHIKKGWWQDV